MLYMIATVYWNKVYALVFNVAYDDNNQMEHKVYDFIFNDKYDDDNIMKAKI